MACNLLEELSEDDGDENWAENLEQEDREFTQETSLYLESLRNAGNEAVEKENEEDEDDLGPNEPSQSSQKPVQRMALNDHKAGMEGLDKEKINKIIFEASKGSKFYENEKKKEKRVAAKISSLKDELASFSEDDFKRAKKAANKYVKEIKKERDLSKVIVHVDMDAFYAAVETRDDSSLKDIPMAVGSLSMLSTSNYAARKYGVRAAMPGFIAKKLCPHLKIVPEHFEKYKGVSNQVRKIIAKYDPNFSGMGLDEAYLDLTEYVDKQVQKQSNISIGELSSHEVEGMTITELKSQTNSEEGSHQGIFRTVSDVKNENMTVNRCPDEHNIKELKSDLNASTDTRSTYKGNSANERLVDSECAKNSSQRTKKSVVENSMADIGQHDGQEDLKHHSGQNYKDMAFIENITSATKSSSHAEDYKPGDDEHTDNENSASLKRRIFVENIVSEMRAKIFEETKLTASAGIAPNVMLAKVCSDMNKPNGQFYLEPNEESIMEFVRNLPIRKISGIGRVCEQILNAFGIKLCKDLYEKRDMLYLMFSSISFEHFMRISQGIGGTHLDNDYERKSMSTETTFSDTQDPEKLMKICHELCLALSTDLKKENLAGRNITLKMKLSNFQIKTRTRTINNYISSAEDLYMVAKEILKSQISNALPGKLSLRLMGVRVAEFGHEGKGQNKLDVLFMKKLKRSAKNEDISCSNPVKSEEEIQSASADCENASKVNGENARDFAGTKGEISPPPFENQICGSSSTSDSVLVCPVCLHKQPKNTDINKHIDACLNKQVIKEMLQQDKNVNSGRLGSAGSKDPKKEKNSKRKSTEETNVPVPKRKKTLLNFWAKDK